MAAAKVRCELADLPELLAITHAWVIMPDHLHWLMELGAEVALSTLVQGVKSRSAIAVNRVTGGRGPVWQSGFYDHRVRRHEDLLKQAKYLIDNPIRKGLVDRAEDYPHWWCRWIERSGDSML
jgi:REP element-mobilizing transposase RayT